MQRTRIYDPLVRKSHYYHRFAENLNYTPKLKVNERKRYHLF
jgi:hypothetical protein